MSENTVVIDPRDNPGRVAREEWSDATEEALTGTEARVSGEDIDFAAFLDNPKVLEQLLEAAAKRGSVETHDMLERARLTNLTRIKERGQEAAQGFRAAVNKAINDHLSGLSGEEQHLAIRAICGSSTSKNVASFDFKAGGQVKVSLHPTYK